MHAWLLLKQCMYHGPFYSLNLHCSMQCCHSRKTEPWWCSWCAREFYATQATMQPNSHFVSHVEKLALYCIAYQLLNIFIVLLLSASRHFSRPQSVYNGRHDARSWTVSSGLWRSWLLPCEWSAKNLRVPCSSLYVRRRKYGVAAADSEVVKLMWCMPTNE